MFIAPKAATTTAPAQTIALTSPHDSLDAMLALGQEEAHANEILQEAPVYDTLDFLTGLIDESLKVTKEKAKLAENRKLLKNTSIQGSRRKALEAEVTRLALQQEWSKVAYSLWVRRCTCEMCGEVSDQFTGVFERQRSRHSRVDRWVAIDMPADEDKSLPRECRVEEIEIGMCQDCLLSVVEVGEWDLPEGKSQIETSSNEPEIFTTAHSPDDYEIEGEEEAILSSGEILREPQELEVDSFDN